MANMSAKAVKQRVSGVILIDKPQGLTSQQVVSKVKYLFKSPVHDSKKAGHTGTLDPMATGLLPVCLGEATKFSHYQLDADKSYEAVIKLGIRTDTGDAEGQIVENQSIPDIDDSDCERVAQQFLGEQLQTPPMYSALKKDGKKLYEYARAGIEVAREPRAITLRQVQLQRVSNDKLRLRVTCTKGTYVRVLGEDIAQALGTVGHLISLRRTQVGDFSVADAIELSLLEALDLTQRFDHLLSVDACIDDLPVLILTDEQVQRVRVGQRLNVYEQLTPSVIDYLSIEASTNDSDAAISANTDVTINPDTTGMNNQIELPAKDIRLTDSDNTFVGLATLSINGRLQPKKILAAT